MCACVHAYVHASVCVRVPGCVRLVRWWGEVEILQGTAVSFGRCAEGAGGCGCTAAGARREDGLKEVSIF